MKEKSLISRKNFLKAALGLPLLGVGFAGAREAKAATGAMDALTNRAYQAVKGWTDWLERNGARGYFGETGWPNGREGSRTDLHQWNALGEKIYSWLDDASVWATFWTANSFTSPDSIWKAYGDSAPEGGLEPYSQAAVIEGHRGFRDPAGRSVRRGVNANGAELKIGLSGFSNENPGAHGTHYRYPSYGDLAYLKGRGHGLIRLPFRWERVQPAPGGPLDAAEVGLIRRALGDAAAVGQVVILDVHNYANYRFAGDDARIGSARLPVSAFADLWRRLSLEFGGARNVVGYDLMNEPGGMPGGARTWEEASRAAVDAIRATGSGRRVIVAGYHEGGGVISFVANHPRAWIDDPASDVMYTTHGYWGHYGYSWTYDESNAYWEQRGY